MERIDAKIKVSTLIANYARRPRNGRKLAVGTADRVTDRILDDPEAVAAIADLDPNDDYAAAGFVRRFGGCFYGAGDPRGNANVGSVERDREAAALLVRATKAIRSNEIDEAGRLAEAARRAIAAGSREATEERFLEDVLELVSETPVLFRDLVGALRGSMRSPGSTASGRRWRNVNEERLERTLRDLGAYFRCRRYGSGLAVYVATAPFDTVVDGRFGKTRPVRDY